MKVPGSKMALHQGILCLNHRNNTKIFENPLLQNDLLQLLEVCYIAWPSGLLPNLFKCRFQDRQWFIARGPGFKP